MRELLRSLAALGVMFAAGATVGAAERAIRDSAARRGAAALPEPDERREQLVVAPDAGSLVCSFGRHDDCLWVAGTCACTCHAPAVIEEPPALERAEFFCRHLMAELSRMEVRGFDTGKKKAAKRAELDEALDTYNLTKALED